MPRVLLTAGPTREYLDAVRYLSNRSSGRMGVALARAFAAQGATVTLVAGPCEVALPRGGEAGIAEVVEVVSAAEMYDAVASRFAACDIFVAAAAVADYKPAERLEGKRKKEAAGGNHWTLELVPTADILLEMGKRKGPRQTVVGFALEAHDALANANAKRERKRCDLIVLNSPANFGDAADTLTLLDDTGKVRRQINEPSKESAAAALVEEILSHRHAT